MSYSSPKRSSRSPRLLRIVATALAVLGALTASAVAHAQDLVRGIVLDAAGAPVIAEVHAGRADGPVAGRSDRSGRFAVAPPAGASSLTITAPGFAPVIVSLPANDAAGQPTPVRVVLQPASLAEQVTVTAGRRELRGADTPAAAATLTAADLLNSAALGADDALRNTPGFTLFRRSSSRVANPTTQGVTLRGLSASGASRTLVLAGGVPLNDPFGGWVYWGRVPQAAIERIEIVRGGMSDLYGADAVGGVINIIPWQATRASARGSFEAGSLDTNRVSLFGGARRGRVDGTLAVERLSTEGAPIVSESARGPIDTPAGVTSNSVQLSAGVRGPRDIRFELRGQTFGEDRQNGTPLQTNDTDQRQLALRVNGGVAGGMWQAQAYGVRQTYDQAFSSVAADRASENLTQRQRVPSDSAGGSAEWFRGWTRAVLLVGTETRRVSGATTETRFVSGAPQAPTSAGGVQETIAAFTQVTLTPMPRLTLVGGARVDHWENRGRFTPDSQSRTPVSPRVDASFALTDTARVRGAFYRAFRSPTLNELYRNFRAGDSLTQANPNLAAERLTGGEASFLWTPSRHSLRATWFVTGLDDAIANVTVSTTPTLITRQRQNAGAIQAQGLELEGDWRLTRQFTVSGMMTVTRSQFDGGAPTSAGTPSLDGLDVPQVPRYAGGVSLRYVDPRWLTASLQVRAIGRQFEDDRNTLVIDRATIVDLFASRELLRGAQIFVAIENLLDAEIPVGRLPVPTVGLPRVVRLGVRAFWP